MNKNLKFSIALLVLIFSLSFLWSDTSDQIVIEAINLPPSFQYWCGTDSLGRDLFSRIFVGLRYSLIVALSATFVDCTLGVTIGSIAGYCGGWIDTLLMRCADAIASLPYLLKAMLITMVLGRGLGSLIIALSISKWVPMARIVRGHTLSHKHTDFVRAAQLYHQPWYTIIFRHILPSAQAPILATMTLTIPRAIFAESFLSYLGLGLPPPQTSLGLLVVEGLAAIDLYPWRLWMPTCCIVLLVLFFENSTTRETSSEKTWTIT